MRTENYLHKMKEYIHKKSKIISIVALIVIGISAYQYCYMDYARRDQLSYMSERLYFKNDHEWFINAINYNRTRKIAPGDCYLFRPGLYCLMATEELFLKDQLVIRGAISILLHLSVVILVYLVFRRFFLGVGSFLLAAVLASQYAGIEMIAWRHISLYMVSIGLTLGGFWLIFSKLNQRNIWACIFLMGGMLIHEVIPASMVLVGACLMVGILRRDRSVIQTSLVSVQWVYCIVAMIGAFLIFDWINWLVVHPPSLLGIADQLPEGWDGSWMIIQDFARYFGAHTRAVFDPFSVALNWKWMQGFYWDIASISVRNYCWWAAAGASLLLTAVLIALRRIAHRQERPADIICLWACCAVVALTAMLSFARGSLRDPRYLSLATYNYWFFSVFYLMIAKYILDVVFNKISLRSLLGRMMRVAVSIFLVVVIFMQVGMTRSTIRQGYDLTFAKQLKRGIDQGKVYFERNPEKCMDTSFGMKSLEASMGVYLYQHSCSLGKGTSIVHIVVDQAGNISIDPGPYSLEYQLRQLLLMFI